MSTEKTSQTPAVSEKKADRIAGILDKASQAPEFDKFTPEQKEIALEIVKGMFERFPTLDFPKLNPDGSIEMDLMDSRHFKAEAPKGSHVMTAQREMSLNEEKGDKDEMLPVYVMSACSTIDGAAINSIFELQDGLSARDFKNLVAFFRSANLL